MISKAITNLRLHIDPGGTRRCMLLSVIYTLFEACIGRLQVLFELDDTIHSLLLSHTTIFLYFLFSFPPCSQISLAPQYGLSPQMVETACIPSSDRQIKANQIFLSSPLYDILRDSSQLGSHVPIIVVHRASCSRLLSSTAVACRCIGWCHDVI